MVLRGLLLMEANGRYVKTSIIALPMYAVFVKKMSGGGRADVEGVENRYYLFRGGIYSAVNRPSFPG